MRNTRYFLFVLLTSICQFAGAAQPSVPLINYENLAVSTASGQALTASQVKDAIAQGATAAKWIVAHPSPGVILATLSISNGKHMMVVEIPYTAQSYSITYKDSVALGYGPLEGGVPGIHPNYNRWVNTLKDSIRVQFLKY